MSAQDSKRIAFTINSFTGNELRAGNRDVARVYSLLTDPAIGMCRNDFSKPIHECKTRNEFWDHLSYFLNEWSVKDQLLFYFSGHGSLLRHRYCIKLGKSQSDFLPFENLMNDLDAFGVKRAILIIDACHSGAGIKDEDYIFSSIDHDDIPKGIAIIASSKASQTSKELDDGSSSVFTEIFCKGLETGLEGQSTKEGFISVGDMVEYIKIKLESDEKYSAYIQRPVFKIIQAENNIYLAKNICGTFADNQTVLNEQNVNFNRRSIEEIEFEYQKVPKELHPCIEASIDDISWELVKKYADKIEEGIFDKYQKEKLLAKLNLFSPINHREKKLLHKPAILCFCKRPETIFPQARSVLVIGNEDSSKLIGRDINGPLSEQVKGIIELLKEIYFIDETGERRDIESIDSNLIRELISNAINHRDYDSTQTVKISIDDHKIEIQNPGKFPSNITWDKLIKSDVALSHPVNAHISLYLRNLLVFEGRGRGFSIVKRYLDEHGPESIKFQELYGTTTVITVFLHKLIVGKNATIKVSTVLNKDQIDKFRISYLNRILKESGILSLEGVDHRSIASESESRLNLGSVYTALMVHNTINKENDLRPNSEPLKRISALEVLNKHQNLVLLGDPGSGKTTFVNFIACCMAGELLGDTSLNLNLLTHPIPSNDQNNNSKQVWDHGPQLPVRIVLRDFTASISSQNKATASDLWNFIESELRKAGLDDFSPYLKRELMEKGGLILLDGLDEVPEAENRRVQLKSVVEDFINTLPRCRILVTSRTYAYQKQEWRIYGLNEAVLAPFSLNQIEAFIERWYFHIAELRHSSHDDAKGRAELLKNAILGSYRLKELAERPLLLTLMASLHSWRGGSLPEKREELYSDTVDLLLDWWESPKIVRDKNGEAMLLQPSLIEWLKSDRSQLRRVLDELAYNAHAKQTKLSGTADISESQLVTALMKISNNPDLKPIKIIKYLTERAGLIIHRGVGVYSFPHRTFQEYLAACHLTDFEYPDAVAELSRNDPNRWREVCLLSGAKASRGSSYGIWSLAEALCYREPDDREINEKDIWGAHLAGQALAENATIDRISPRNESKLERIKRWLLKILSTDLLPPVERAISGNNLSKLDDPRFDSKNFFLPDEEMLGLIEIPESAFLINNFGHDSNKSSDISDLTSTNISKFYISKYPVTFNQFQLFIDDSGYQMQKIYYAVGNNPVVYITIYDALAYCKWLSQKLYDKGWIIRLPSETEWMKAAIGIDGRIFPWGNDLSINNANFVETGIGKTSPVGCFPEGKSPYGCHDMIGNVWEFTIKSQDYQVNEDIILKGGSFQDEANFINPIRRIKILPEFKSSCIGFRIVADKINKIIQNDSAR